MKSIGLIVIGVAVLYWTNPTYDQFGNTWATLATLVAITIGVGLILSGILSLTRSETL